MAELLASTAAAIASSGLALPETMLSMALVMLSCTCWRGPRSGPKAAVVVAVLAKRSAGSWN
jgi:hypothetical protein